MISVVIATLNRAEALREISLPSILRQDNPNFEVIVWDASDDDASKNICESMRIKFDTKNIALRYFKAPRKGLPSQRNDGAVAASGDIIFFIDDDCELSVDAISALYWCFDSFPWIMGAGLPMLNKTPSSGNSAVLQFAARLFGMKNNQLRRKINGHGGLSLPLKDLPGPAEWLSGGSMAVKKCVFEKLRFDERLETFGGYALGEDYDFSHRVTLEFGQPLMVAQRGYVVHHAAVGKRIVGIEKIASHFFNANLIRKNFELYGVRYGAIQRAWGTLGIILFLMREGAGIRDIVKGFAVATRELKKHRAIDE